MQKHVVGPTPGKAAFDDTLVQYEMVISLEGSGI